MNRNMQENFEIFNNHFYFIISKVVLLINVKGIDQNEEKHGYKRSHFVNIININYINSDASN